MLVFLNGQFVPEERALVSVFDRGFLYGDGLFETIRVSGGHLFCWAQHLERLRRGTEFLKLQLPFGPKLLQEFAKRLIEANQLPEALLRICLSRGVGPRGYSPKGANRPSIVMSLHPAPKMDGRNPARWRLRITSLRLATKD